jgi:steroid 5-alpha reductase family enzyme
MNIDWTVYLLGLAVMLSLGIMTWLVSVARRDVSIVDSLWSLMFLAAGMVYAVATPGYTTRAAVVLGLLAIWALRLSAYITWRNHGQGEDHRYQAIRRNNEPNFAFKSLYIVFGFQAVLAWIISLPLATAIQGDTSIGPLDVAGIALWLVGMFFEVVGDHQLAHFKTNPDNKGRVLDTGLWRYTRHPNYFGEFCIWWGFFLLAASAGAWWSVVSPLLMSFLLLKFSGVALLEKDIAERRPEYRNYVLRTNAFFPGPPRPAVPTHNHRETAQ